jgi:CHAD domain-containing protein
MARTFSITVPPDKHDVKNRIHRTLLQQFDETFALSHKVLRRTDPTNVQLMSSAFRRLFLAFSDLNPFVTDQSLVTIQINLRGIVDALGEIHYQDMAILALEEVASQAPRELAQTIQQLIEARKKIRRKSRQTLERVLVNLGENILRAEFEGTGSQAAHRTGVIRRRKPAGSLKIIANSIIQNHLTELEECSELLEESPQATELDAMDRATQRLQYAIELFSDCWTADVRLFSRSLANLQRALRKVSEYDTLIKEIRKHILELKKTDLRRTKRTFVVLFAQFSELRNFHLDESSALWNAWETDQLSNQLRKTITSSI